MSDFVYLPKSARCADGVTRTARVKCHAYDGSFAADTWFSVPARVKAKGKTVRGYVTSTEDGLAFHAYLYRKNHAAIVPCEETTTFDIEVTDTFGGAANYCWVHRHELTLPANATRRQIVRAAKALEGWTGERCEVSDMGDTIDIRPRNACMVMFIDARY